MKLQEETNNQQDKKPMLAVEVNLGDSKESILVFEGDKADDLVLKFAVDHKMDEQARANLQKQIEQEITNFHKNGDRIQKQEQKQDISIPRECIYFNHGATSYPKPPQVLKSVMNSISCTIGSNRGVKARLSLDDARQIVADFIGAKKNEIIFTAGCTMALNQAILGFPLEDGDHIVYSSVDHHAVARPCRVRQKNSMDKITAYEQFCPNGQFDLKTFEEYLKENPVKLVVTSHVNNVLGTVFPADKIGDICHKYGAIYVLDCAQSGGHYDIPIDKIDCAAFAGHKGLRGLPGSGFLYKASHVKLDGLMTGGTGGDSGKFDISGYTKPQHYEVGTQPVFLYTALAEGIKYINSIGIKKIRETEHKLFNHLLKPLQQYKEVTIYGCDNPTIENHCPTVALNVENLPSKKLEKILLEKYNVIIRAGYHCSSFSHNTIGTLGEKGGAARISLGFTNTIEEVDQFLEYFDEIINAMRCTDHQ